MTRKKKIKYKAPRSFNYRTDYRDKIVEKSVENYSEQVRKALNLIYANHNLTLYDFEEAFISKLLSDDLVEACNVSLFDLGRNGSRPQTTLRLTKAGCARIGKSFVKAG